MSGSVAAATTESRHDRGKVANGDTREQAWCLSSEIRNGPNFETECRFEVLTTSFCNVEEMDSQKRLDARASMRDWPVESRKLLHFRNNNSRDFFGLQVGIETQNRLPAKLWSLSSLMGAAPTATRGSVSQRGSAGPGGRCCRGPFLHSQCPENGRSWPTDRWGRACDLWEVLPWRLWNQ
ncbi:hypothetical protein CA54_19210 [Symmachiella macrocystis]|uniref:Uncharacterized protein n=1 Tax=Symmachiella macrocystis TaxID=2527985 RepID=A0A5C6BM54_9PLAN|nr:hypothetical protein CA54_19210 [Symmachiella macrocystis]